MLKKTYLFVFSSFLLLQFSCGTKEEITPAFEAKKLNKVYYVEAKIGSTGVSDMPVAEFVDVPVIGQAMKELAVKMANIQLKKEGGREVIITPQLIDLSGSDSVNLETVESLKIVSVQLELKQDRPSFERNETDKREKESVAPATSFKFIKSLDVFIEPITELEADRTRERIERQLGSPLRFDASNEALSPKAKKILALDHSDSIDKKTLNISVPKRGGELIHLLKKNEYFKLSTRVKVIEIPDGSVAVGGKVRFRLEVNLPF